MEEDAGSLDANALDAGTESSPFGIRALMTPLVGGPRWTSAHWANGHPRQLTSARDLDADDPTGWSSLRGSGSTLAMEIDGDGVMTLVGNQPRIYLTPTPRPFENVEVTFYYRRDTDDDTPWGGAIVGMRSGVDGHSDGNCDAHTYYARLRHDGDHDFEKELQHPASASRDSVTLYPTGLPRGVWIGVKVVLYTRADGAVVLDHYRDLTEGADGGTWERMGTQTVDDGGWAPAQGPECGRADDYIIIEPGSVLIRDTMGDAGRAHYRWLSVVEITPPG